MGQPPRRGQPLNKGQDGGSERVRYSEVSLYTHHFYVWAHRSLLLVGSIHDFWWLDWQQGEDWINPPSVNPTFWLNYYVFFTNPYNWNGTESGIGNRNIYIFQYYIYIL